jgi:lipoprotein-anchoring transpeptidase ErfK/SrfK
MLARFFAAAVCAGGVLAAIGSSAATANPFSNFFSSFGNGRTVVSYATNYKPGTIVISTQQRRLYLVLNNSQALSGVTRITAKREWPDWTPPDQMLRRRPDLPRHMAGGLDNPLGARAMYLGSSLYRIHGSNEPNTIGTASSSGCFRLTNDDVVDLYSRVSVGATVIVQ